MDYMKLAADATIKSMHAGHGGPFGSTIVRNGEVVVAVGNTMMRDQDLSAHAELVAVREACHKLDTMDLSDCEIYATCEPCPMCVGVILWSGIKKVYYASGREDAAANGFSDMHLRRFLDGSDQSTLELIQTDAHPACDQLWEEFKKINA